MRNRNNTSKTAINIICSVLEMGVGLLVSFFLSPYIIRTIGVEANGFVGLAQNFTTYAGLVVTALNGMAARYITIAYVQKDMKRANMYYNSVFWGNLIIVAVLLIPAAILVINLEKFINTPQHLILDVKILFTLVFLCFFLQTGAPNWDCGTAVTNRLDRTYIPNMITSLLRPALLLSLFSIFEPRVWYIGMTSLVLKVIYLSVAGYNTHALTPELKVHLCRPICSWKAILELVGSGIWNSISCAGNMLFSGLDLLICNLSLGPTAMGILSLSKTLPSIHLQFVETLRGAFGPELTIAYAQGDQNAIVRLLRRDIKICAVVVSVITGGIIVMCDLFYHLWVPSQDAKLLQTLTILAVLRYITDSGVYILENVFPTTNKVRYNACGLTVCGIVSICATLLLINLLDHDLYVIASVSSIVAILRSLFFMIPATSHFIGLKWYTFYPQVAQSFFSCIVIAGIYLSDKALKTLVDYYSSVDRDVIIVMVGDHAPSFAADIANEFETNVTDNELELNLHSTPFVIWANREGLLCDVIGTSNRFSLFYLTPTVLQAAGIPLTGYYDFLVNMRTKIPVIMKNGSYYDSNFQKYEMNQNTDYSDLVQQYLAFEYLNIDNPDSSNVFLK